MYREECTLASILQFPPFWKMHMIKFWFNLYIYVGAFLANKFCMECNCITTRIIFFIKTIESKTVNCLPIMLLQLSISTGGMGMNPFGVGAKVSIKCTNGTTQVDELNFRSNQTEELVEGDADTVTQKRSAKIHDFCLGIPFGKFEFHDCRTLMSPHWFALAELIYCDVLFFASLFDKEVYKQLIASKDELLIA